MLVPMPQQLVRDDGVQDGLLLPGVEVQPAACSHHVLAEPPGQQLGRGRRNEFQQLGRAGFETEAQ